jgi:uncharacterized protein involved in tolerance to divalent cations
MVNVIIYLKKEHNAIEFVKFLLTEKLVASASMDENNVSYKLLDGKLYEDVYTVITAQTKSLLFNEIVKLVEERIGDEIPIISSPIVASNRIFDDNIKSKTIAI